MSTKKPSAGTARKHDEQADPRKPSRQGTRRQQNPKDLVTILVAQPLYSSARSSDRVDLILRSEPETERYVAYPARRRIEPLYFPFRCKWVELTDDERELFSSVSECKWSATDFRHLEIAADRAILSIAWEEQLPKPRYLVERLNQTRKALVALRLALGELEPQAGHSAIVSEADLFFELLQTPFFRADVMLENLDEMTSASEFAISILRSEQQQAGRYPDFVLHSLLTEVAILAANVGIKPNLPSNSIGEKLVKSTPLSAIALEVCRLVSRRGLLYLDGPHKRRLEGKRRLLENNMRAYSSMSELTIVKRLRRIKSSQQNGEEIVDILEVLEIDESRIRDKISCTFNSGNRTWQVDGPDK